jgi:UDP-2,3-diacylglucosamine pyrophosphatase LpxH
VILCSLNTQAAKREKFSATVFRDGERISHESRELLIKFNYEIDKENLDGHIDLSDGTASLINHCSLELYSGDYAGKTVEIRFADDFSLAESGKYTVTIKKGLRYIKGERKNSDKILAKLAKEISLNFVTSSTCPLESSALASDEGKGKTGAARTKYIVVSDIHMGDARAQKGGYGWFTENITELQDFLDAVLESEQTKELVIAGDLFDEWILPVDVKPFEGNVTNSDEFFESIAQNPTLSLVIEKFNAIADSGKIRLVYVPGNHDLLMSEAVLKKIVPNAVWAGINTDGSGISGTGLYSPEDGIYIEHGHIYDFYNAPDPLTHSGRLLPPGYFVSRMFATNMIGPKQFPAAKTGIVDNLFFYASWELVLYQVFGTVFPDIPPILTGIDGYKSSFTYAQARDNYFNAKIGDKWGQRQQINGVNKPENTITGLLNGAGLWIWADLQLEAQKQYFEPNRAKIVVFGHTHRAMMKGYNQDNYEVLSGLHESMPPRERLGPPAKIYANSGTWVDKSQTPKGFDNRTYVVISPAQTAGALDTVSLYQYNPDKDGTQTGCNILLEEMNLHP